MGRKHRPTRHDSTNDHPAGYDNREASPPHDSASESKGRTLESRIDPPHGMHVEGASSASPAPSSDPQHAQSPSADASNTGESGNSASSSATQPSADELAAAAAVSSDPHASQADLEPPSLSSDTDLPDDLRLQTVQLAAQLKGWQFELDQREARANAREAEFENHVRTARLWLEERNHELADREAELNRQLADGLAREQSWQEEFSRQRTELAGERQSVQAECTAIQQRSAQLRFQAERLKVREEALTAAQEQLDAERRTVELQTRYERQQLEQRRLATVELVRQLYAGLERRRASLEVSALMADETEPAGRELRRREIELDDRTTRLAERERQVENRELELRSAEHQLHVARQQLEEHREAAFAQAREQRHRMTEQSRLAETELDDRRKSLERLSETLDCRRLALEQTREQINRLHREALEMRLMTEELWSQLETRKPGPVLTQSLGKIRAQVAERYRLEINELCQRQTELAAMQERLAGEHERLAGQRAQLQKWLVARQEELHGQLEAVATREDELGRRESACQRQTESWHEQRLALQREIRELRNDLHRHELATAA